MRISDVLWVVHDEGEVGDEDGLCREGVLADCGWDGGGVEQGYRIDIRDPLHLSYGCLKYESVSKCLSLYLSLYLSLCLSLCLCHSISYGCLCFQSVAWT